ncbi:Wadjet anti-phage system protein JetD domain-containing protein [Massilia sp. X63]|uniref:DUF3322 domain-containing protein n=1 Tax=Massilia sp. X63 TaxID=3237285 RepID=UPI0034DDAE9E
MKTPAEVRQLLLRRFGRQHRTWLEAGAASQAWPLDIPLGLPGEQAALAQMAATHAWVRTWQAWNGEGTLCWTERRWRTLGTQRLPERLRLDNPRQLAWWIGELDRWDRAVLRHAQLVQRWPALAVHAATAFDALADFSDSDIDRLVAALAWFEANPRSGLYLRQVPIPGLDTKWIEARQGLLCGLISVLHGFEAGASDIHALCGLRRVPGLVRMRALDPALRQRIGGLGDLSAPVEELARLDLDPCHVLIVENLQTGLALEDLPGVVAFMALGYGVDQLGGLPWLGGAHCLYWGDIDTHGFAILNRARGVLPNLRSFLMDQDTLLQHRPLWSEEPSQHPAQELERLHASEAAVYRGLKQHAWGASIRLEQERVALDWVAGELQRALGARC